MFDATTIQVLGATLLVTLVALLSSSLLMLGERSLRVWIPRLVAHLLLACFWATRFYT